MREMNLSVPQENPQKWKDGMFRYYQWDCLLMTVSVDHGRISLLSRGLIVLVTHLIFSVIIRSARSLEEEHTTLLPRAIVVRRCKWRLESGRVSNCQDLSNA
ncbi:hypothetical protein PROFUN_13314 [Planoprotostelium fungivorum]|uniref:Uncharacterized protein n=1 Tax=Planoprotostelium fungivorum TaxID=1890364 RepID=A0A2P6N466_9EUKA|nr:hypothetical protein PROFUN_13314 [Planoprotostelium fungivorum]